MKKTFTSQRLPFLFVCLLASSLIFSACNDDDEGVPPRPEEDLLEVIGETEGLESLDSLVSLLGSDFNNRLASGEFTIFAPNNEAFSNLLSSLGYQSLAELRTDILSDIIFYHIVANNYVEANALENNLTTLGFSQIAFEREADSVIINPDSQPSRTVVTNSVPAANGIVHITNEVLLSPDGAANLIPYFGSVAGITSTLGDIFGQNFDGGISTINSIFNSEGLLNTLSGSSSYTVLTPLNVFFNGFFLTETETIQILANNHVLSGNVDFATADRTITAASGQTLYVSNSDGAIYLNGQQLIDAGYSADNGKVVHLLGVIKQPIPLADMVDYIDDISGNTFTIFRKALAETAIEVPANSTIFMPTDAAFEAAGIITTIDSVALEAEAARIDPTVLASILQSHVVPDNILFTPDFEAGNLTTLNGTITLTLEGENGTITLNDNNPATETNANLQAPFNNLVENGIVIHAINQVLLP